ncbi:MAG: hypothetical protein J0M08_06035 [Bacteroidetes bacterium]|nr:hypothetical protein [Bacteroidota bacterium]
MATKNTYNRLDDVIKDSLKNLEVPYNEEHWNEFESKLTAQSPVSKTNWKPIATVFAGIAVIAGIIFGVSKVNSNKQDLPEQQPEEQESVVAQTTVPAITASVISQENTTKDTVAAIKEEVAEEAPKNTEEKEEEKADKKSKKDEKRDELASEEKESKKEKKKKKKGDTTNTEAPVNFIGVFDSLQRTRVATFGDMIDPKKGFIKKTNEDPNIQKAAQEEVKKGTGDDVINNSKEKIFSDEPLRKDSVQ